MHPALHGRSRPRAYVHRREGAADESVKTISIRPPPLALSDPPD
ncbi:hypothetical protein FM114_01930 [Luteococcus japonicus LSP_Lj1]|uniref:Uncharacterized protein n=1 Tax=Luteococcus japonicus LSP_Lj1 TaxID=1255658 RepID=A0A1R4IHE2_9ACTN|nr:hypothetical protein FM114_01930 [Luteococcus japonicus LSP_Lj1]